MSIISEMCIPMMGSVEHARLVRWLVEQGAEFSRGDPLYELETDKTVTTVEADESGIIVRVEAEEDQEFSMGDRIGLLAKAGSSRKEIYDALAEYDARANPAAPSSRNPQAISSVGQATLAPTVPVKSSPRSRRLAREHDIDISVVTGTGPRGRVTGEDVLSYAAATVPVIPDAERSAGNASSPTEVASAAMKGAPCEGTSVPHSTRRRAIAKAMATAKREAPHLTADMDVDLTGVAALRARYKQSGHPAPSVLGIIATHAARLLSEHRTLNASFLEHEMMLWNAVNLNIGIDTDEGLVAPVVRDAQLLTAKEMTERISELAQRARLGRLKQDDLSGGTFTISNPGAIGPVVRAEAVLNGNQVALLGMPGIDSRPVAIALADGSFAIQVRPMLRIGITFDHRALDGGPVIRFLKALKHALEHIAD